MIEEAKGWPSGPTFEARAFTPVATFPAPYSRTDPLSVCLGKPGKEVFRKKNPNEFDMTPAVLQGVTNLEVTPSFRSQFAALEEAARLDPVGAELIGSLLVRSAFALDHEEIEDGIWRYRPSKAVLDFVEARTPELLGIPASVTLHLFDAIALNEDVKFVGGRGYGIASMVGRPNNLLTGARIMAALLGRTSWAALVGELMSMPSGIAPLKKSELAAFPALLG